MKTWGWVLVVGMVLILMVGWWRAMPVSNWQFPNWVVEQRPLDKYSIEELGKRKFGGSEIKLKEIVSKTDKYEVRNFEFISEGKKVTGQANVPMGVTDPKIIILLRGYWPQDTYKPGDGTRRVAAGLAQAGFMTLAPDQLGYGGSDMPGSDVFEERFQTYTTTLNLIASVDQARLAGIWGHSNGGQIALTVGEILNKSLPIVVWAPVTARFPYSILYYMGEAGDGGKYLRKKLANFEKKYNADDFALTEHTDRLIGPVQIHQGTADPDIPMSWSRELVRRLKAQGTGVKTEYFEYAGADHNLQPQDNWNRATERTTEFFDK
jgi:dipeptidyl aminopeptidase/acylaminoacyl peptidase